MPTFQNHFIEPALPPAQGSQQLIRPQQPAVEPQFGPVAPMQGLIPAPVAQPGTAPVAPAFKPTVLNTTPTINQLNAPLPAPISIPEVDDGIQAFINSGVAAIEQDLSTFQDQ